MIKFDPAQPFEVVDDQAFDFSQPYEEIEPETNILGAVKDIGTGLLRAPLDAAASAASIIDDPYTRSGMLDPFIESRRKSQEEYINAPGSEEIALPGTSVTRGEVRGGMSSLGYSGAAMGASFLPRAAAAGVGAVAGSEVPLAGTLTGAAIGWVAGAGAAGTAAYRMDTNNFIREYRAFLENQTGKEITDEEFATMQPVEVAEAIKAHGLHEAGWEGIANMIERGAMTQIFKGGGLSAKALKGLASFVGFELGSETATQIGQTNAEVDIGMRPESQRRSFTSPEDIATSAREVLPATVLLAGVGGGGAYVAGKIADIGKAGTVDDAINAAADAVNAPAVETPIPEAPVEEIIQANQEAPKIYRDAPMGMLSPQQPAYTDAEAQAMERAARIRNTMAITPESQAPSPIETERTLAPVRAQEYAPEVPQGAAWNEELQRQGEQTKTETEQFKPVAEPLTASTDTLIDTFDEIPVNQTPRTITRKAEGGFYGGAKELPKIIRQKTYATEKMARNALKLLSGKKLNADEYDVFPATGGWQIRSKDDAAKQKAMAEYNNNLPEDIRDAVIKMESDISQGEVGGNAYNDKSGTTQRYKSTNPDYIQLKTLVAYDKKHGTGLANIVSKDSIAKVISAVRSGKELTGNNRQVWDYIKEQAANLNKTDAELVAGQEAGRITKEGIDIGQKRTVVVGDLSQGDKVVVENKGIPDVVEHKGYDEEGNIILEDGKRFTVDRFDKIDIFGEKKADGQQAKDDSFTKGQKVKSGGTDLTYQGQDAMGLHNFRIESEGPGKLANITTKTLADEDIAKTVEAARQRFVPKSDVPSAQTAQGASSKEAFPVSNEKADQLRAEAETAPPAKAGPAEAKGKREETFFSKITTKFLKDSGAEENILPDGMIRVFHGTKATSAAEIKKTGKFNGYPFFATDRKTAEKFGRQAGGKKVEVMEIIVDPDVVIPTGGYLTARIEGLVEGKDGVWSAGDRVYSEVKETPPSLTREQDKESDVKYSRAPKSTNTAEQVTAAISKSQRVRQLLKDGRIKVVQGMDALPGGAKLLNMTAWHGSPHKFDKFSTENIGSGEGAQAYGYGLYFASSKDVAEWYKRNLAVDGMDPSPFAENDAEEFVAEWAAEYYSENGFWPSIIEVKDGIRDSWLPMQEVRNAVKSLEEKGAFASGSIYEVELAPAEDEYLLWDRPLSEQSEKVKKALKSGEWDNDAIIGKLFDSGKDYSGDGIYQRISSSLGDPKNMGDRRNDKAASDYLHSLGIRGIKYLDGTSRAKGEGAFNYVIFKDEDVSIKNRYSRQQDQIGGAYGPKTDTIYLVSDGIEQGQESRVLEHEAFHRAKEQGKIQPILDELGRLERMAGKKGSVAEWFAKARESAQVDKGTPQYIEEIGAYAVQNYEASPNIIKAWVDKLIAKVKAALFQTFGVMPKKLDPAFLREIALSGLRGNVENGGEGTMFSRVAPEELEALEVEMKDRWVKGKTDISRFDRMFSTIEKYAEKVPVVGRYWNVIRHRTELKFQYENAMLKIGDIDAVKQWGDLSNKDQQAFSEYMVKADAEFPRYQRKKAADGTWTAYFPDKENTKDLGEDESAQALFDREHADNIKDGMRKPVADAIRTARMVNYASFKLNIDALNTMQKQAKEAGLEEPTIPVAATGAKFKVTKKDNESGRAFRLFPTIEEAKEFIGERKNPGDWSYSELEDPQDHKVQQLKISEVLEIMGDIVGNYFPRVRKTGDYILRAYDKNGKEKYMKLFDAPFAENWDKKSAVETMKKYVNFGTGKFQKYLLGADDLHGTISEMKKKGWRVEISENTQLSEDVFEAPQLLVSMQNLLDSALESTPKDQQDAAEQLNKIVTMEIGKIFKMRGSLSSRLKRKPTVIAGYETDAIKAVISHVKSIAGGLAKRETSEKAMKVILGRDISWPDYKADNDGKTFKDYLALVDERRLDPGKQREAYGAVMANFEWSMRNQTKLDRVVGTMKGLATLKYLGFRLSSPAVNMTNMVTGVPAAMHANGISFARAASELRRASTAYVMKRSAGDARIFDYIASKGWDAPQFNQDAAGFLQSQAGKGYDKVMSWAMFIFGVTEKFNRAATISAAYRALGGKSDVIDAKIMEKARDISDEAHGVYQKETLPEWAMGEGFPAAMARTGYTFTKFTHNYLLNLKKYGFDGQDKKAATWLLISPAILSGVSASAITPVIMAIAKAMGEDEPEEDFYKWVEENTGIPDRMTRQGIAGAFGIDIRGSLGVRYGLPTTIKELLGAPYSVVEDVVTGAKKIASGEVMEGIEKIIPAGIGAPLKALREYSEGITTESNQKVFGVDDAELKGSGIDAAIRAATFNPARLAAEREKIWHGKEKAKRYSEMKGKIYSDMRKYLLQKNRDIGDWAEILMKVEDYNRSVMDQGEDKLITDGQIKSLIKKMRVLAAAEKTMAQNKMAKFKAYEKKVKSDRKRKREEIEYAE